MLRMEQKRDEGYVSSRLATEGGSSRNSILTGRGSWVRGRYVHIKPRTSISSHLFAAEFFFPPLQVSPLWLGEVLENRPVAAVLMERGYLHAELLQLSLKCNGQADTKAVMSAWLVWVPACCKLGFR